MIEQARAFSLSHQGAREIDRAGGFSFAVV
jgi:hypothetical protein